MVEYVNYKSPKGPKIFKFGKYSFSDIEIKNLSIALVLTSLTLYFITIPSLFSSNSNFIETFFNLILSANFLMFILAFVFAFLLHEFGHKFVAQNYGFVSEFRADIKMMLIILVLAMFSPFILIAPGAVMIFGHLSKRQNGIISIAGPLVNLFLILISLFFLILLNPSGLLLTFLSYSILINAFLGVFNMLTFWVLD